MSRVLCTFPGRYGDIGWSLLTVRAISEAIGEPVDLQIAGEFASIVPLLYVQPYLGHVVADPSWGLTPPGEWRAPDPGIGGVTYDHVYHLGYRGWPSAPLAQYVYQQAQDEYGLALPPLDLARPWIQPVKTGQLFFSSCGRRIATGWSDCYFELKYGLQALLNEQAMDWQLACASGRGRWFDEGGKAGCTWAEASALLAQAEVFLGDCSALHVLAVALGKPVVLVEPMEARHNAIFYPLGTYDRVRLVRGNDGLPTFDARHTADTLREVLAHVS